MFGDLMMRAGLIDDGPAWFVIDRKGRLVWKRIGTSIGDHPSLGQLMPVLRDVAQGLELDD